MNPKQNRGPGKHRAPAVPLDYYESLAETREPSLFFVFYNGQVTERDYFEGISRDIIRNEGIRSQFLHLEFKEGTPKQVVDYAISEIKKRQDENEEKYDDIIWVVFGKDDFGDNYSEAVLLAQDEKMKIAFSNECFELWLLLYFQEQHECIKRKALSELLRKKWEETSGTTVESKKNLKRFPYGILHKHGNLDDAITRAKTLRANAEKSHPNDSWNHNPVTSVHLLIENMKEYFGERR